MLPSEFLTQTHEELRDLLDKSLSVEGVQLEPYEAFRTELLKHIGVEEHIVLPLVEERSPQRFFALKQIRLEHRAIGMLLALQPSGEIITVIRNLLKKHDFLEETPDTLYDILDDCCADDQPELLKRIREYPGLPLSDVVEETPTLEDARRAIYRAGYTWEKLLSGE